MTDADFEQAGRVFGAAMQTEFERRYGEVANTVTAIAMIHTLLADRAQLLAYIQRLESENAALRAAYIDRTQKAIAAGLVRWVVTGDRP